MISSHWRPESLQPLAHEIPAIHERSAGSDVHQTIGIRIANHHVHLYRRITERSTRTICPFDQRYRSLLEHLAYRKIYDLADSIQSVQVGMDQGLDSAWSCQTACIALYEGKRRACHSLHDTQRRGEPLGEGGLSRSQLPGQQNKVPAFDESRDRSCHLASSVW